ncbi:hypothetical protein ACPTJF_20565, partial [Enterococcus faecalis]
SGYVFSAFLQKKYQNNKPERFLQRDGLFPEKRNDKWLFEKFLQQSHTGILDNQKPEVGTGVFSFKK